MILETCIHVRMDWCYIYLQRSLGVFLESNSIILRMYVSPPTFSSPEGSRRRGEIDENNLRKLQIGPSSLLHGSTSTLYAQCTHIASLPKEPAT